MMNLMFTGGGGPGNEAIYRLWKDQYNLYFADADLVSIHPDIPRNVCFEIPIATSPNFFNQLLQIVKNLKIEILIPGVDEELLVAKKLEVSVSFKKVYTNLTQDEHAYGGGGGGLDTMCYKIVG